MSENEDYQYLDHGYVRVIGSMGSDQDICRFARTSFGNQDKEYSATRDRGLINYLFEHYHTSPIESCELAVQIKMPIFVMRQHVRHRTASLNEYSLRYAPHCGDYYIPEESQLMGQSKSNHQCSEGLLEEDVRKEILAVLREQAESQKEAYESLMELGLAREKARMVLGVNFYTVVCWKIDLKNLFHYLSLRNSPHSQYEIRVLAQILEQIVEEKFPMAYSAYKEFWKNRISFSETEMDWMRTALIDLDILHEVMDDMELDPIMKSRRRRIAFADKVSGNGDYQK